MKKKMMDEIADLRKEQAAMKNELSKFTKKR